MTVVEGAPVPAGAPLHWSAPWVPCGLPDLDRLEAQLLRLDAAWLASYRALRDRWCVDHGDGTSMRYGTTEETKRVDRHFRRVADARLHVIKGIRRRRAQLPADVVRDLAPRPWLLREGCYFPWEPDSPDRRGFDLYGSCVVSDMAHYARLGVDGIGAQGDKCKGKSTPYQAVLQKLLAADGEWVSADQFPRSARCGSGLDLNVECALVVGGWWVEIDALQLPTHDEPRGFRLLGHCEAPCSCPGVRASAPAVGGVEIVETALGRGKVPQLALDLGGF